MNKRIKYVNEMEDYLYNHNYISENNNNIKQQELSLERASCIVQKHRTLTEEKDKEIERLTAESTEWESKCYKYQDIIDELEKELEEVFDKMKEKQVGIGGRGYYYTDLIPIENILDKLKELKGE